jgi:heat shock protein HspQ
MKIGDLVRHTHFGYIGIIVGRQSSLAWLVLWDGVLRNWWPENMEVINESR